MYRALINYFNLKIKSNSLFGRIIFDKEFAAHPKKVK